MEVRSWIGIIFKKIIFLYKCMAEGDLVECRNNLGEKEFFSKDKIEFRPSVYGILLREKEVLLMRTKSDGKFWLPGGGVEIGEKLKVGLKREFREETGLDVKVRKFLFFRENFFHYSYLEVAYQAFLFFYACEVMSEEDVERHIVDDLESEKPRWIPVANIHEDSFSDFSKDIYGAICFLVR